MTVDTAVVRDREKWQYCTGRLAASRTNSYKYE
jgi:hypothetical protein